jgi:hypothetical protein
MFVWTIQDLINGLLLIIIGLVFGILYLSTWWAQRRCPHDKGVTETSACDAICCSCGKNLGFIGNWRSKHRGGTRC